MSKSDKLKGWVYIISNRALPGLVKVGYSTKDPKLRAEELSHTGTPHPYIVEYEMLIEEPFEVEQQTHKLLKDKHEGKEWFRCSIEDAVLAIKMITGPSVIYESVKAQNYVSGLTEESRPFYKFNYGTTKKCARCDNNGIIEFTDEQYCINHYWIGLTKEVENRKRKTHF